MSDYETDIVVWSQHQAGLLRRVAAGEPVNQPLLLHILKSRAWPTSRDVPHWQAEARTFRGDAADRFTPAMRQKIDMAQLYRRALRGLPETMDGQPPFPVSDACPFTLDELLSDS